jgi:predicted amidohydrolase YtcJ
MPAQSCVFALSATAGILAVILALFPPWRFQFPFSGLEVYCYQSVRASAYEDEASRCFTVTSNGTISKVWEVFDESDVPKGVVLRKSAAIPGLWDGHGHILGFGDSLSIANLHSSASMDDVFSRLRDFRKRNPEAGSKKDWLRGFGWDQAAFGRMPTALDLENDFPGKYTMLSRVDSHCIWVSEAVLDLLPDPIPIVPGGEVIGRGVLCDSAMDMVFKIWPKPTADKIAQMVISAMRELNKVGIVGVHEAGVTPATLDIYKQMVETKAWTLRIYAMLECPVRNTFCPTAASKFARPDGLLSMRSVKLFSGS